MPIYEFRCQDCHCEFEELCSAGTTNLKCPKCASANISKKFSVFSANSKGSSGTKNITSGQSCGSCHGGDCGHCH